MTATLQHTNIAQRKAERILDYLAPYFGIKDLSIFDIEFHPAVRDAPTASFRSKEGNFTCQLYLRDERDYANCVLAHELGHCLHWASSGYEAILSKHVDLLQESVANYAEIIFHFRKDIFSEHRFSLSRLLRLKSIHISQNEGLESDLTSFNNSLIKLKRGEGL